MRMLAGVVLFLTTALLTMATKLPVHQPPLVTYGTAAARQPRSTRLSWPRATLCGSGCGACSVDFASISTALRGWERCWEGTHSRGQYTLCAIRRMKCLRLLIGRSRRSLSEGGEAALEGDVTVELGPGVHAPFTLDPRDSGTAQTRVVYQGSSAMKDTRTVVSAGVQVPPQVCKERKETASDPVVVCDLSSFGLNKTSTLGFR
eukprot:COSAG02_NODE_17083_length_1030_cov_0.854995_1_plen_203_part_10